MIVLILLKELIKDEIIDAQVKLKMKPTMISLKKGKIRPLYIKKLDRYKYIFLKGGFVLW